MSASAAHRKSARPRAAAPRNNTRKLLLFGGIAIAALSLVGGLIAVQAGGSSASIPPRTVSSEGRILGDANAPVTIIEYADFQCPVCKRAETAIIAKLQTDYIASGKVNIEFRNFAFLGQESFNAAQAADAAGEQGKFWEYHDALFNAQGSENSGTFTYDKLVALARQIGLDVPAFEAALSSNTYLDSVQKEADSASQNGVSSTPTFFIGDEKIVGVQSYSTFTAAIDAALAKAGK
jgi:protein-disulfide isomerase